MHIFYNKSNISLMSLHIILIYNLFPINKNGKHGITLIIKL